MDLTIEQYDIINSTGNIKINAVAGSGKTTTILEYAKTRPRVPSDRGLRNWSLKNFMDRFALFDGCRSLFCGGLINCMMQ